MYAHEPHMYDNVRFNAVSTSYRTYTEKQYVQLYAEVRFNAVPTSYRTYTVDLLIKSTLDITSLERRFVLVLDKMH